MTKDHHDDAELEELVSLLLEGKISSKQFGELQSLLASDPNAMWYYVKRIDMQGSIGWALNGDVTLRAPEETPDLLDLLDELPAFVPVSATWESPTHSLPPVRSRYRLRAFEKMVNRAQAFTYRLLVVGAMAIALLIASIMIYQVNTSSKPKQVDSSSPPLAEAVIQEAAKLVSTSNCQWILDGDAPRIGDSFLTGQTVSLESGMAEFVFESGARVILQGHSTLRFDTPNQGTLTLGTLAANVPEEAIGFSVEAGKLKVIDLGTEFGVAVAPSGTVQAEVFVGKVSVQTRREVAAAWEESQLLGVQDVLSVTSQGVISRKPMIATKYAKRMPGASERIAIRNPSFELPVLPYGNERDMEGNYENHGVAEGWKIVKQSKSNSGNSCLRPLQQEFDGDLPHGRQIGYTNHSEILSQVLTEVCEANTGYQLSVWVGWRNVPQNLASRNRPNVSIELLAGETVIAQVNGNPADGLAAGDWRQVTLKVTTPVEADYLGQPLAIRFRAGARSGQMNYDSVDLVKQNAQ